MERGRYEMRRKKITVVEIQDAILRKSLQNSTPVNRNFRYGDMEIRTKK